MSGQKARKTRIGSSRHRVSNQNKNPEANDGFLKTDSPTVTQDHKTEENIESGGQNEAPSEGTGNRRKLGSSRRIKGRRDVRVPIAESQHETNQEVVENTTNNDFLLSESRKSPPDTTEMESASQSQDFVEPEFINSENQGENTDNEHRTSENKKLTQHTCSKEGSREINENRIAEQSEVMFDEEIVQDVPTTIMSTQPPEDMTQEELSRGEHVSIMSVKRDTGMHSPISDDSFEFQNPTTHSPEAFLQSLISQSKNVEVDSHDRESDSKLELTDFCRSEDVKLKGIEKFHTFQSEDNAESNTSLVDIAEVTRFTLDSVLPTDPQLIDESISREMRSECTSVHSTTDSENKERAEAMELLQQCENLQANYLESELPMKKEVTSPIKPVTVTGKSTSEEPTVPECVEEQERFTLPTERFPTDEKLTEDFILSQVMENNPFSQVHQSEDAVNKVYEQDVMPTQMKELSPSSSTCATYNAIENVDIPFVNLVDADVEIGDAYQSELTVTADDSANNQEVSNSDKEQDEHTTKENNLEVLNQRNVDASCKPFVNKTEGIDTAPDQVYDNVGKIRATMSDTCHEEDLKTESQPLAVPVSEQRTGRIMDSTPRHLLGRKDYELTEEAVKEKKDVMEPAEILQAETFLITMHEPNDKVKEAREHRDTPEITGQVHEQALSIGASDLDSTDMENNRTSSMDVSKAPLTEELDSLGATSQSVDAGNPVISVQDSDASTEDSRNSDPCVRPEEVQAIQDKDINEDEVLKSEETFSVSEVPVGIERSQNSNGAEDEDDNELTITQAPKYMSEGAQDIEIELNKSSEESRSANRRRKMGSTRRNLRTRPKEEGLERKQEVDSDVPGTAENVEDAITAESITSIEHKDETMEGKLSTDADMRNQVTFEAERESNNVETDMTHTYCISTQSLNQEENNIGNMDIIQMGGGRQPHMDPFESPNNEDVGGYNEPDITERRAADSISRSLHDGKQNEVTEEAPEEMKEVMNELSVEAPAEILQTEKVKISLITMYEHSNDFEEAHEHPDTPETTGQAHEQVLSIGASDLDSTDMENNDISNMDISKAPLTEELDSPGATSQSEDVGNPVISVQDSDARDSDGNVEDLMDDFMNKFQQDDVMNTEMHTSVVSETSICSLNHLLLQMPSSTEDCKNSDPRVRPEEVQAIQDTDINEDEVLKSAETSGANEVPVGTEKSENSRGAEDDNDNELTTTQAPKYISEGAQDTKSEINKSSEESKSANRRRKMGSTRRSFRTAPKGEGLERKQEVDSDVPGTAENVEDAITAESITSIEHKYDETMEGKLDTEVDMRSQVSFEAERESNNVETDMTHAYCISTQSLNQKDSNIGNMDIMKELSEESPAELLQAEKVQTSLITMYEPNYEIKEEKEHPDTPETTGQAHEQVLSIGASDLDSADMENNDTSNMNISKAPLTEELDSPGATSQSEDVGNPVISVQDSDVRDSDVNVDDLVDDSVEKSQQDDVMNTEIHTSVVSETSICSLNQLLLQMPSSTEDSRNSVSSVRPGEVQAIQDTDINEDEVLKSEETSSVNEVPVGIEKSENSGGAEDENENALTTTQAPNNMSEGAQVIQMEISKSSQGSRSPNRRRKMGSTRRNLRTRPKEEGLERKQEVDSDVTGTAENVRDAITAESITSIEHKDDETMEGKLNTDADMRGQVTFEAERESNNAETDMTHTYCISTQSLNQKKSNIGNMDITKELSLEAPTELLQAEKLRTSLITIYEPNEVKEEKEYQDTPETTGQAHEQVLSIGASDLDSTDMENNRTSNMDVSKGPLTEELDFPGNISQREDVGNPVISVQDSDARDGDGNIDSLVDDSVEKSQQDDVMNTEIHTSLVSETSICSLNQLLLQMPSSTEDSRNSDPCVRPEEVQAIQDTDINEDEVLISEETSSVKEVPVGIEKFENSGGAEDEDENALTTTQAPNNMSEGAQVIQMEISKSSQGSRSPNRRRKMGSTRRNLRTRPKEEELERKQEVDSDVPGTAENVGDAITAESITSIEHKYDETMEGKLNTDADLRSQVTFEAERESNTAETDMTHAYCISTQPLNQEENIIGMDIMKELSAEAEAAEILQTEKVKASMITMYKPNGRIKKEEKHKDTQETTGQGHGQNCNIGAYKIDTTTVVSETSSCSLNQLLLQMPPNLEDCRDSDPIVRSEEVQVIQDKDIEKDKVLKSEETSSVNGAHAEIVKSENSGGAKDDNENALTAVQAPNNMSEGAQVIKIEIKSIQESRSPSRRRKMGSTRRNLRTSPKEDKLQRKAEVENEAPEKLGDATTAESVMSIQTEELQLQMEDKDDESNLQLLTPQSLLGMEDRPLVETERLPSTLATFPEQRLSESKIEGRRRKMGSNRKSKGHQHNKDPAESEDKTTDEEHGRNHQSDAEERAVRTSEDHRAESEVVSTFDRSDKTPSSSNRILDTGDPSKPVNSLSWKVSEQVTPIQHPGPQDHLGQKTERKHSLVVSKESGLTPHYNVVLVGNSNVGKTSFMKRVQSGKFCSDFYASVGIDTCRQPVMIDGKKVMLQLWDTAGQERFHSITRQIFHKAQAFLLMYDITSFQSFSDVRYWISCIQEGAAENVIILLLGNKSDCAKRQVDSYDSEVLAKDYSFEFMECSAATGENVTRSLETVARMLCEKADTKEEGLVLHKEPQQKKSSGCC